MLAGMGANFLYTAISRCKAPPAGFPYIYSQLDTGARAALSVFGARALAC
jgi:hypothetical protein